VELKRYLQKNVMCWLFNHKKVTAGRNGSYTYLICKRRGCNYAKWLRSNRLK
jgi:hypothetical protein